MVLGCGSNVVDHIYRVKVVPQAGAKGFFASPFRALEKRLLGGVTLNHLCWAAVGGVSAGLLALQGKDELGRLIRRDLQSLGVSTQFISTSSSYSTAQCHVFIQDGGERSIMMAPAATSLINADTVQQNFGSVIQQHASMVTTEISQVPLSGVLELLTSAKKAGILSILDLDIPPSVAEVEAGLGTVEEVVECVKMADILKPAKAAAEELVTLMSGSAPTESLSPGDVAQHLVKGCGSKLVAMTNGAEESILANSSHVVCVAPPSVGEVVDSTGAGDAFLGGLIAGITRHGGLPTEPEGLAELGRIANAFGASCTQSVGGVPTDVSRSILREYLPDIDLQPATGGNDRGDITGFTSSLSSDLAAANSVAEGVSEDGVESFISALAECPGAILTSGIGR
jgi:sugar/nucleoside kinase (ribokinase family)